MSGYDGLSLVYDRLIGENYAARADYLLELFARHGCKTRELLDLACGSGRLTVELARRGCDMIGADRSEEMLARARAHAEQAGVFPLWLCQDMRQLDLYGTVNGAVCTLDGFNHLLTTADILQVLRRLRLFIEPGGLLIFDVNTPYKHRQVLGDSAFVYEQPDFFCAWRNCLRERTCEVRMLLDIFLQNEDDTYTRFEDEIVERAYTAPTWERLLKEAEFSLVALYGDKTTKPPAADEQRWVLVAKNERKM